MPILRTLCLLLIAATGTLHTITTAAATELTPVKLQLKWKHQFQFAGYYMAKELGLYQQAGLAVSIREVQPGRLTVDEVVEGNADFGVGTSSLIYHRGRGLPVVVLGAIFQHSPLALVAPKQAQAQSIHDLATQTIMLQKNDDEIWAYLYDEGINPKKIDTVEHNFSLDALLSGEVGALTTYTTQGPYLLEQQGFEYQLFNPRSSGIDFYGDNLFTSEAYISDHPDRVNAFYQASIAGWKYAFAHPEEAIDVIIKHYSTRLSRDNLRYEAKQTYLLSHPKLIEVGYMNPGRWQSIAETYVRIGMLKKAPDLDKFIYQRDHSHNTIKYLKWLATSAILLLLASALTLYFARVNKRLNSEIFLRTKSQNSLRKANLELRRKKQNQQIFIDTLSHEYRTPLSVIRNACELLARKTAAADSDSRKKFATIERSIKRLVSLVDLNLNHQDRTEARQTDGGNAFSQLQSSIESARLTSDNNIISDIVCGSDEHNTSHVTLSAEQLSVCFDNIIGNAIKYSQGTDINIKLRVTADNNIAVTVSDRGIGIHQHELDNIFNRFYRAQNATHISGAGLGLYLVKKQLESAEGSIDIKSQPNQGTSVTLKLPQKQPGSPT